MRKSEINSNTVIALRRVILSLLSNNRLTVSKEDQIYALGHSRGYCQLSLQELMLDCYAEVGIS